MTTDTTIIQKADVERIDDQILDILDRSVEFESCAAMRREIASVLQRELGYPVRVEVYDPSGKPEGIEIERDNQRRIKSVLVYARVNDADYVRADFGGIGYDEDDDD